MMGPANFNDVFPAQACTPLASDPGRNAMQAWRTLLGNDRVIEQSGLLQSHGRNAYGSPKRASAMIRPQTERQVVQIVRIAAQHRIPLHPISTGRNWE
ncbi:MAG: hypothetical protein MI861_03635 [Pirellulales bacterium]|nr:hypothetical protein [Pirellulales bacterium]